MVHCPKCNQLVEPIAQKQSNLEHTDEIRFFHDIYYDLCPDCNTYLDTNRHNALNLRLYTEKYNFYKQLLNKG
jgi:uncharacterized protein with PIN domain